MKIGTSLFLLSAAFVILIVALGFVMLHTSDLVNREVRESNTASSIIKDVSELNIVTYEYLLHHEERMHEQWLLKYDSLGKLLEWMSKEEIHPEHLSMLESITSDYESLGDLFSQLQANFAKRKRLIEENKPQAEINLSLALEERLIAQVLMRSQKITSEAFGLSATVQQRIVRVQQRTNSIILFSIIGFAIVSFSISFLTTRAITGPLSELVRSAEIIGKGNLKHRVDIKTKNEIGELAAAFDQMTERRQRAEEALRESEEKFRQFFESEPAYCYMVSPEGTILDVNRAALKTLGYSKEEIVGKPLKTIYAPESLPKMKQLPAKWKETGQLRDEEMVILTKNGDERTVLLSAGVVKDQDGKTLHSVSMQRDITERKKAEEALQKRTEEIEVLYKAGRQLGQTLNIETIYRRLHDWVANSMDCDGLSISSYDSEEELVRCDFAITEGNQLDASQFPPIPLEPEGQGTQSVVIRTGEPMLIRNYQARIETATAAYHVDEEGTIVGRDQAPRDEDVTRSALIIPVKFEGKTVGVIQIMSYRLNAYTGNDMRIIESLASQIAVAGNNALLYQQAQGEITQRKQVEEDLREHRDHLEELVAERTAELDRRVAEVEQLNWGISNLLEDLQVANRNVTQTARGLEQANSELGSFVYSVSHDLRAPLRHIDRFAQLLLTREAARLEPTSASYLQNIVRGAGKMGRLIDDLLTLSRTSQIEMKLRRVAPNEIVERVRQELEPAIEGRRITWDISPLPAVRADPGLLRVVWTNLLSNAVKYTGTRPEACIEIGATPPDGEGQVTFFVRDDGVGFNPQYAHKLFGVFQRLHHDEEFEGSGIGLATVRRILHRHGGRVWAEGEPDRGATFYFTLSVPQGE